MSSLVLNVLKSETNNYFPGTVWHGEETLKVGKKMERINLKKTVLYVGQLQQEFHRRQVP